MGRNVTVWNCAARLDSQGSRTVVGGVRGRGHALGLRRAGGAGRGG